MKFDIETDGTPENTHIVDVFGVGNEPVRLRVDDMELRFSTLFMLAGSLGLVIIFRRDNLGHIIDLSVHVNTEVRVKDEHKDRGWGVDGIIPFPKSKRS